MNVQIFSDIVCPFCYIGKRQFGLALEKFEHRDDVQVLYRSFELNKKASVENDFDIYEMLASKYSMSREQAIEANERVAMSGESVGIEFHIEKAQVTNSFNAHRLCHLASKHGLQAQAFEALHRAYFSEGIHIGRIDQLIEIGTAIGLDKNEVESMFNRDYLSDAVRDDETLAADLQITGVPFFIIDGKYAISGAQGEENFLSFLDQVWQAESH